MDQILKYFIALPFVIFFISCDGHDYSKKESNELNSIVIVPDTIKLNSDYLFSNLENNSNSYIYGLSFRNEKVIFTYKNSKKNKTQHFSASFLKTGDTINLNNWDDTNERVLMAVSHYQTPAQLALLSDGSLKVIKINSSENIIENGLIVREDVMICKISDIIKISTYDSINYYSQKYIFNNNIVKYENPCQDMDSYNLGYSYAADQLGGGLLADCDYLYNIAVTQRNHVDHYCFCKGINKWLSDHNRTY